MVVLIFLFQTTQDRDRVQFARLIHHDGLEPTFQGFILFEVFLILVEGRGTDTSQLTSGQCRLQDVGCIHGTFALTCTYQGVNLINEKDDLAFRLGHLVHYRLQTFLKLSFIFRSGDQRTHIE